MVTSPRFPFTWIISVELAGGMQQVQSEGKRKDSSIFLRPWRKAHWRKYYLLSIFLKKDLSAEAEGAVFPSHSLSDMLTEASQLWKPRWKEQHWRENSHPPSFCTVWLQSTQDSRKVLETSNSFFVQLFKHLIYLEPWRSSEEQCWLHHRLTPQPGQLLPHWTLVGEGSERLAWGSEISFLRGLRSIRPSKRPQKKTYEGYIWAHMKLYPRTPTNTCVKLSGFEKVLYS